MQSTNHTTRSPAALRRRLTSVGRALERVYGDRRDLRAKFEDPLSELIATILSQNTTAANTNRAYEALRAAFPTWEAVMTAPREEVEHALRPAGLAKTRSERIQALLRAIADERGHPTLDYLAALDDDAALRELLRFRGVGPKTAYCTLLFGLNRDVFPVDTHIHRILIRLGVLPPDVTPEEAHDLLRPLIPPGMHLALHVNLIAHGRRICRPTNPRCDQCILRRYCEYPAKDAQSK